MTTDIRIVALRKRLHQNPELSGKEHETARILLEFLNATHPDKVITQLGGNGLAIVYDSHKAGSTILFRADMDALPIPESNTFDYRSRYEKVSHKCGHDGHMAILSALGQRIAMQRPEKGRAILLFQPAEETGQGAYQVLRDKAFAEIAPDLVFGMHNLPGYPMHSIVCRNKTFASASKGMIIQLQGRTSHAAEPEKGLNPAKAVSRIIQRLLDLPNNEVYNDFVLVTLIHVRIGEKAFGTSAGEGELMITLRAYQDEDMKRLTAQAEEIVRWEAKRENLKPQCQFTEEFPATVNDDECIRWIQQAAKDLELSVVVPEDPFRWSEDFGYFTQNSKGAMFGVGAGVNHPPLHHPGYDFPDEIIYTAASVFFEIYKKLLIK